MSTSEKIRIILIRRNMKIKDLAASLGYKPSNFSTKLSKDDFSESELKRIAEALNCDYNMSFTLRDTGEKV